MSGVASGAEMLGMKGLEHSARSTINAMEIGAGFGDSIINAGKARILENEKLLQALGKKTKDGVIAEGEKISNWDLGKSLFYNRQGELQKGRVAAGIAGSYMGANVVGNGSLGIPFISTASWNR